MNTLTLEVPTNQLPKSDGTPPPSRDDRIDEAAWLLQKEAYYRWCKAQTEDLAEARLDEEFNRWGC